MFGIFTLLVTINQYVFVDRQIVSALKLFALFFRPGLKEYFALAELH